MIEKFSDYEGGGFIDHAGTFVFEVMSCETAMAKSGSRMAVFKVRSDEGSMTMYQSLQQTARGMYNRLIKACLNLSPADAKIFQLDYDEIGKALVGKKFVGFVEEETYMKISKVQQADGTYVEEETPATSFKIKRYDSLANHPELVFPDEPGNN